MRGRPLGLLAMALAVAQPSAASVRIETIALSGTQAPGAAESALFASFAAPQLSDAGAVAFAATLMIGPGGVTSEAAAGLWGPNGAGGVTLLAQQGTPLPPGGSPGDLWNVITGELYGSGELLVQNDFPRPPNCPFLCAPSVLRWRMVAGVPELFHPIAGEPARGVLGGVFEILPSPVLLPGDIRFVFLPLVNEAGDVAFIASLLAGAGGVVASNNEGIWGPDGLGGIALVAREGTQVPDAEPGAYFKSFRDLALNNAGEVAFVADLGRPFGDPTVDIALWGPNGEDGIAEVARGGAQAPGAPSGAAFLATPGPFTLPFSAPVLGDAGALAFIGRLATGAGGVTVENDTGIWYRSGQGALSLLAREGAQAPGAPPGAVFSRSGIVFRQPVVNGSGDAAFSAYLDQGTAGVTDQNDAGIWGPNAEGELALLAREGDSVGGSGRIFGGLDEEPQLDEVGNVVFYAGTRDSPGGASDMVFFWHDATGRLLRIVGKGDLIEVAPGDVRTVADLAVWDLGEMNRSRQVGFHAGFTDTSEGIFVETVPEAAPGSGLAAAGALAWLRRRARRSGCPGRVA